MCHAFNYNLDRLEPRRLLATVSGLVWDDVDLSGTFDEAESATGGATIYIDANRNGRFDSGERSAVTSSTGRYAIGGLTGGTYDVAQVPITGRGQASPDRSGTNKYGFDIEFRYLSEVSPAVSRAVERAARRWESIIVADLPLDTTDIGPVDDLVVDVSVANIDGRGGTLAEASPTAFRDSSGLPSRAVLVFDSADLATLQSRNKLSAVATHELAHALGFGTIWQGKNLINGSGTGSPRFVGPAAVSAYNTRFGGTATSVPLEPTGGTGTPESHWRESVFDIELMTPEGESAGVDEPISEITIAQFADLGYTVDTTHADTWDDTDNAVRPWQAVDSGVRPFATRVAVTAGVNQSNINFATRSNRPPVVQSFRIAPTVGDTSSIVTLSATAIDPDGDDIFGMTFYRETNGRPGVQSGEDVYVATKFATRRGRFEVTTAADSGVENFTFYAVAVDPMLFAGRRTETYHPLTAPTRPNPLVATPLTSTVTRLTWKDRSADEAGFRIEIYRSGTFDRAFNLPANSRLVDVIELNSGTSYEYRIRSYNDAGVSAYTRLGPVRQPA